MTLGLSLRGISLHVGGQTLIANLSLDVAPGEIITLMGPSGCGKSSLLAYLCGTLSAAFAARGEIILDDRRIEMLPPESRQVGILFQDDLLFPHLTVGGNLAFALPPDVRDRDARVGAALADAELAGFDRRATGSLSGGQRQRVALMRALLAEPRVLLLDEPFSRLDRPLRAQMRSFVFDHARKRGLPVLLVTHDDEDAAAAGGRVVAL